MYCTTAEVLGKIRDDMIDAILGSDLIEDEQERTEKITACTEEAISDACAEIDGWVSKRYRFRFRSRCRRSSASWRRISPSTTWQVGPE